MTEWIEATIFNYRQRNARQHSTALDVPWQRLLREPALLKAIACWLAWAETLRKHATNDSRLTEARNLCRFIPDEGLSRAAQLHSSFPTAPPASEGLACAGKHVWARRSRRTGSFCCVIHCRPVCSAGGKKENRQKHISSTGEKETTKRGRSPDVAQSQVVTGLSTEGKEQLPPLAEQIMSYRNLLLSMPSPSLPPMDGRSIINTLLHHTILISRNFQPLWATATHLEELSFLHAW